MVVIADQPQNRQSASWQVGFLNLLPRIKRYACTAFRGLQGEAKEDAVCEVIANCLCAYWRLYERNELHRAFASSLVRYAVAMYHGGRRVGTSQFSRDVYSRQAREVAGIQIHSVGAPGEQCGGWMECLTDNRRTSVPEQVHFRIEFPRWLNTQTRRNRQIVEWLSLGYSTGEVARRFSISKGRVSQLRLAFFDSWNQFSGNR